MMVGRRQLTRICLLVVLVLLVGVCRAQEDSESTTAGSTTAETAPPTDSTTTTETPPTPTTNEESKPPPSEDVFDPSNTDWGSYYDPQNIFCGKYDCYKILGFDYESFGEKKPDTKEITKRYRKLGREWHPDKSKHKDAKERFVKIARAYEVLTSKEKRTEYDMMRYNQEAYFQKYGTSVLWSYAPKTDVTIVIILLFAIGNVASWYGQKHRWQMVADRFIKAAVEDWSPSQGGTPESKQLREEALKILAERQKQEENGEAAASATKDGSSASLKKKANQKAPKKVPGKEKKKQEQESLQPIITELVYEMDDFGGGFHKPTWEDLLVVSMVRVPYQFALGFVWQVNYWFRRLQGKELNDEERQVLTERAVGPIAWAGKAEEEREQMVKRELWKKDNLLEWQEEEEVKKLSAAEQKAYYKLKKKGKLE